MNTQLTVIQPNAVTNARYDYTQMQKDFMYHYIEAMNKHMTKEKVLQTDIFGGIAIELDLKDICKANNHTKMLNAIKDLQKRPISYHYNKNNEIYDVSAVLVAAVIHKRNTGKITIKTTEESLPYIMWLGEGFTAFNKAVALSLPSLYAKRLYEICCRWKDKGFCRMPIKEFRQMMNIEDKYKQICEMRENVLDVAQKMMDEQADVKFTYELRRENGSRSFNWLELRIDSRYEDDKKTAEHYQKVYTFLYAHYRDSRAFDIVELLSHKFELKKAAERFGRLQKDINTGKVKPHGILAYISTVLYNEFEIPDALTGRGKAKANKQKAAEIIMKAVEERKRKEAEKKAIEDAKKPDPKQIIMNLFGADEKKRTNEKSGVKSMNDLLRK